MVSVESIHLPRDTEADLRIWQAEIDTETDYARRVKLAADRFPVRRRSAAFRPVLAALDAMCSGARRCMYCEDSVADEVEHHQPKNLYPDRTFVWDNLLFSCGPCNGPKNNRFRIFNESGESIDITRRPGHPVEPPSAGLPLLLNPRFDNPLDHLMLDIAGGTFRFVPIAAKDSREYRRAEYTIEILGLNLRSYLQRAREDAFRGYRARIVEFGHRRDAGANSIELDALTRAVARMAHPTVFHEMRRQRSLIPALNQLFADVPEALSWRI